MSNQVTFTQDQIDFVSNVLSNCRSLFDAVHCYDTEEYNDCAVAIDILSGFTIEEAIENRSSEE